MFRSSVSDPAFRAANWPKSSGSNAGRTARDWFSRISAIPRTVARQRHWAVAPRSFCVFGLQCTNGRHRMLTFRIAITAAVLAFVTALTACLILIQIATFHAAARAASSAAMDAASANTLSRLEADVSELSSFVRVLSSNPSLAGSDDRSEEDGAIVLFKAALRELPQADSLYVGYDNGCWLQVRRLDVPRSPTDAADFRRRARQQDRPTRSTGLRLRRAKAVLVSRHGERRPGSCFVTLCLVQHRHADDHGERTSAGTCARRHRRRPQAR